MKVLGLVGSCKECPNRQYYSGGAYECAAVREKLSNDEAMPNWCPLPDHPTKLLVDQARIIKDLNAREPVALAESDRRSLRQAATMLNILAGHDSGANLRHVFGNGWHARAKELSNVLGNLSTEAQ